MSTVIKIDHLSKAYQLGNIGTGTLSRDLERSWAKLRGKEDPFLKIGEVNNRAVKGTSDVVWSLNDISFNVEQGDAIGIIGRNGAGKSTLLKILSRVTAPTTGSVKIKGRIASLLEVGTGFHPDLSGRENIYLNGAILGMRKTEIKRQFDEILEFAGVERYIDTPVKRYSSGMYVRLAFAVAAHLESEIMIIDEVLAVGDAEFQKKCLGKMKDVSKGQGRTVIFVSHNMGSINQLCNRGILLENGMLTMNAPVSAVVDHYLKTDIVSTPYTDLQEPNIKRLGNGKVRFTEVSLTNQNQTERSRIFSIGDELYISFTVRFNNPDQPLIRTSIELKTVDGIKIANMIDQDSGFGVTVSGDGHSSYRVKLPDIRFYPGTYYLSLYAGDTSSTEIYDYLEDCISFEVIDGGSLTGRSLPRSAGLLFLTPVWTKTSDSK